MEDSSLILGTEIDGEIEYLGPANALPVYDGLSDTFFTEIYFSDSDIAEACPIREGSVSVCAAHIALESPELGTLTTAISNSLNSKNREVWPRFASIQLSLSEADLESLPAAVTVHVSLELEGESHTLALDTILGLE